MASVDVPGVEKVPGVCGGRARVGRHRIPVWQLVLRRRLGASDARTLEDLPQLAQHDLDAAWQYYRLNLLEVERDIWLNDTVGNVPPGADPPAAVVVAGRLLGLSDGEIAGAFDPPATPEQMEAAWRAYRADTPRVDREVATLRRVA